MMSGLEQQFNVDDFLDGDGSDALTAFLVEGADVNLSSFNFNLLDANSQPSELDKSDTYPSKSPWHESDSGISDTLSFVGSPVDPGVTSVHMETDMPQAQNEIVPIKKETVSIPNMNTGAGNDLTAYLLGDINNGGFPYAHEDENPSKKISTLSASGRPVRKCAQNRQKITLNTEDSDSEEDTQMTENKKSVSAKPLSYYSELPSYNSRSDIKIVKVVKPSASAADATADDIMKALEEKSKKNAQQAKLNREKKKVYIKGLEDENASYKEENQQLKSQLSKLEKKNSSLEDEVDYLKSVLANASALSGLLKNISNVKEVKLSASITTRKRAAEDDHSYNLVESVPEKRARMVKENLKKAGVCLHVSDGEACLEFCAHCSTLAQKTHGRRSKS